MKLLSLTLVCALSAFAIAGCAGVSAPYKMEVDRTDQSMSDGNRGYMVGTPPPAPDRSGLKREFIAIDIDLPDAGKGEDTK